MTPERLFAITNTTAICCWILLAIWPQRRLVHHVLASRVLPALFAVLYIAIVAVHFASAEGGFSSLAGVQMLFRNPWMLLAGWLHYLAFDLWVGAWEARDATARAVPRWLLVPCLFLTLMFGPTGWLAYMLVRQRHTPVPETIG